MNARPALPACTASPEWRAALHLGFSCREQRSVLHENRHSGPLRVQKALYPEGPGVCQAILLHPPAGIAGGDHLQIDIAVEAGAHAQITTPGAGKWYRSGGATARQRVALSLAPGATLEWLPQESIVFAGALATMETRIQLAADSRFLGWDMLCLGRAAAGERFRQGHFDLHCRVDREDRPIWLERGRIDGNDPMLSSPAGWAGHTVCGTLLCSFPGLSAQASPLLAALRALPTPTTGQSGISLLPDLLIARYLGDHAEPGRHWLTALWQHLRPVFCGRPAVIPRIWNT